MSAPVDRIVFASASVHIGAFRCPVRHPEFADSGPIRNHCFVFPRTCVVIQHRDQQPFPADPTVVTLYNKGQVYSRQPISPEGDRCDWYAVSPAILREAVSEYDRRSAECDARPLSFARARVDADTYLRQRELFSLVARRAANDSLQVEETVVDLLDRVLARAYADPAGARVVPQRRRAADELAHATCELLGRRFADDLALADIASSRWISGTRATVISPRRSIVPSA